jgi:hypothetical protein
VVTERNAALFAAMVTLHERRAAYPLDITGCS